MCEIILDTFTEHSVSSADPHAIHVDEEIAQYINTQRELILAHEGVNHPFLNAYRRLRLTKDQERHLHLEMYYYFCQIPFYICSICTQIHDETATRQVLTNLCDEFTSNGALPHSELFLEFLKYIGIEKEEIIAYRCLPTTTSLNSGIHSLYKSAFLVKALGTLFAEETQSAAMVEKYDAGLAYNEHGDTVRLFWRLHIHAEIGHSNAIFNCIAPFLETDENRRLFESGISDYMALLKKYWDGVQCLLGVKLG